MKRERFEFFVLTITIFCVGALLYGCLGASLISSGNSFLNIQSPIVSCIIASVFGGYFLFGILSGVIFTAKWLSKKTLKMKVVFTIFFCIPVWLALAGIFYSIPYGIYNVIQYKKVNEN
ncbi:MAG: hypothetical protein PHN80_03360 [Hespellia sp.]|nr:hypothetical protein [Hespellia sp.]